MMVVMYRVNDFGCRSALIFTFLYTTPLEIMLWRDILHFIY